jgi:cytochrome c5
MAPKYNRRMRLAGALAAATLLSAAASAQDTVLVDQAKKRWNGSPHGLMLERILPPTLEPAQLPDPASRGARLVVQYCVQCHNLPNPAMHHAAKWPGIVQRMVPRMQGQGNMGVLMRDMMAGVTAPSPDETKVIVSYLKSHSQRPLDPKTYPAVNRPEGLSFRLACQQCHVLPDPRRHTAAEWPAVVQRMEKNMAWMNRVVGSTPLPGEPQLRIDEINAFLAKYARKD